MLLMHSSMPPVLFVNPLQEGLEAPPEEWAADGEGALEDDDDLPIEALMDEDEDEDLSLAALLRRQMLAKDVPAADASSSSAAASKVGSYLPALEAATECSGTSQCLCRLLHHLAGSSAQHMACTTLMSIWLAQLFDH
jgi:hypothetical protein